VLGYEEAVFPYKYPALFAMSTAFMASWIFSVSDTSPRAQAEREAFDLQYIRSEIGQLKVQGKSGLKQPA
jgi:cation/acetate symporter